MIRDLTRDFISRNIDWTSNPRMVAGQFPSDVRQINNGLYVMYFENDAHCAVYDKNRAYSRGGEGTLVIPPNGASLKPGKFENGLIFRRRQDADHLHRVPGERIGSTFGECLKLVLVLDLSNHAPDGALATRVGEKKLKELVDKFIGGHEGLLHGDATRRGDWRRLNARVPLSALKSTMWDILEKTTAALGPLLGV